MLEYNKGKVAIHPKFNKPIASLRTAVENDEGMLDKETTGHDIIQVVPSVLVLSLMVTLLFYQYKH